MSFDLLHVARARQTVRVEKGLRCCLPRPLSAHLVRKSQLHSIQVNFLRLEWIMSVDDWEQSLLWTANHSTRPSCGEGKNENSSRTNIHFEYVQKVHLTTSERRRNSLSLPLFPSPSLPFSPFLSLLLSLSFSLFLSLSLSHDSLFLFLSLCFSLSTKTKHAEVERVSSRAAQLYGATRLPLSRLRLRVQ